MQDVQEYKQIQLQQELAELLEDGPLAGETSNGRTVPGRKGGVRGVLQNPMDST